MIVVDENLHAQRIIGSISAWYPGRVVSVITLRPGSVIKDEAIPALLRQATQPTFVTINVADFWKKIEPDHSYCIVTMALPEESLHDVPELLHRLFRLPAFKTKALRMGKIIHLTRPRIEYYRSDRRVHSLSWSG